MVSVIKSVVTPFGLIISLLSYLALGQVSSPPIIISNRIEFEDWWTCGDTAFDQEKPGELTLPDYDGSIWFQKSNESVIPLPFSCTFDIFNKICEYKKVEIEIEYYSDLTAANLRPVVGPNEAYSLGISQDPDNWSKTGKQEIIESNNQIMISGILLPGGYFVFKEITIYHDGLIGEECDPTTTLSPTTTTMETTIETATPEGENSDTWAPSTSSSTVYTTTDGDTTINPTTETVPSPELTEEPTSEPTTEETTVETTAPGTTEVTTEEPTTEATTVETTASGTTEVTTEEPTSEPTTEETTVETSTAPGTTEVTTEDPTTAATTVKTTVPGTTEGTTEESTSEPTTEMTTVETTAPGTTEVTTESATQETDTSITTDVTTEESSTRGTTTPSVKTDEPTTPGITEITLTTPSTSESTTEEPRETPTVIPISSTAASSASSLKPSSTTFVTSSNGPTQASSTEDPIRQTSSTTTKTPIPVVNGSGLSTSDIILYIVVPSIAVLTIISIAFGFAYYGKGCCNNAGAGNRNIRGVNSSANEVATSQKLPSSYQTSHAPPNSMTNPQNSVSQNLEPLYRPVSKIGPNHVAVNVSGLNIPRARVETGSPTSPYQLSPPSQIGSSDGSQRNTLGYEGNYNDSSFLPRMRRRGDLS